MVEVEVKIPIGDPKEIRKKVIGQGASLHRERHLEVNVFYDFPSGELKNQQKALRLRTAGKRGTLTFKGIAQKSRSFKVREEFETAVQNPKQIEKILKALGFQPSLTYRKHRTHLRKSRLSIAIDETPFGNFLELEGEKHEITKFARCLGYTRKDFLTTSYADMMDQENNPS